MCLPLVCLWVQRDQRQYQFTNAQPMASKRHMHTTMLILWDRSTWEMGQYTFPNGDLRPARQIVQALCLGVLLITSIKYREYILLEESFNGGTFRCME